MEAKNLRKISKQFRGFTLVELIVVITILVILGTIGFIQLQGFTGSARDSARIENLSNLHKGLSLFNVTSGTYPMPEGPVTITASGTDIGYQGFAKDLVGGIAKLSVGATKDPLDPSIYTTYSVSKNQTKMQLMAFLEDGSQVTAFVPNAYASAGSDYSKRSPLVRGDSIGILLASGSLQPVQESGSGVDVVNTSTGYLAYINNKITINGTGQVLSILISVMSNNLSLDYRCDTPDIVISSGGISQTWQACNIGAGKAGYYGMSAGYTFQWGRKLPAIGPTLQGPVSSDPGTNQIIGSPNPDWLSLSDNDIYGGSGTTYTSPDAITYIGQGGYSTQSVSQQQKMQWPCAFGYHVPTIGEWITAFNIMSSSGYTTIPSGSTDDKINAQKVDNLINNLKIPMAYNTTYNIFMSSSAANNDIDFNVVFVQNYGPAGTYVGWQYARGFMINGTYKRGSKYVRCLKN